MYVGSCLCCHLTHHFSLLTLKVRTLQTLHSKQLLMLINNVNEVLRVATLCMNKFNNNGHLNIMKDVASGHCKSYMFPDL